MARPKRNIQLGSYNTAATGGWTLTGWHLSAAEAESNRVQVPGRNGTLNLSTTLTDGVPVYGDRTLTITLELSDGSRLEREQVIETMTNWLDGWEMDIILPDDTLHYLRGVVHVERLYNDLAHASVQVTAVCDPWKYNNAETVVELQATTEEQTVQLINRGRRTVVPQLIIAAGDVRLTFGAASWALSPGAYQLPDLVLTSGEHPLTFSGSGFIHMTYREAIL